MLKLFNFIWIKSILISLGSTTSEMPRSGLGMIFDDWQAIAYALLGMILWQGCRWFVRKVRSRPMYHQRTDHQSGLVLSASPPRENLDKNIPRQGLEYPCHICCLGATSDRQLAIHACQQFQRELRQKNAEFEAVFQAFPDLFLLLDADGTILEYKGQQRCNVHISPSAIGQQKIQDLLPSNVARDYEQAIGLVDQQQWIASLEYDLCGSAVTQSYEARLVPFQEQKIMMFIRNTTEKNQAERALKASYKQLSDLKYALDQAAIVAVTDAKGKITYVNDRFCTISGYSREELIGQTHRIIKSEEHPPEFFRRLWSTIAQGQIWRSEVKNKAKNGSYYWMDTTIVPLLNERGRPMQYLSIRYDITDRKQAETALHQQEEQLRILHEIDRAILAAQKPEEIAQVAATYLRQLLSCPRVSVVEFNLDSDEAVMLAIDSDRESCILTGKRLPEMNRDGLATPDKLASGILIVADMDRLPHLTSVHESLKAEGLRSCVCLPLKAKNVLLGSLNLWSDRPGGFSPEQTIVAEEVANSLAISIQQARLYQTVQSHAAQLEERVAERTDELVTVNQQLRAEIQQRQKIEAELYQEKELAQVTLNSIGDAVITTDIDGIIQSLNPQAQSLTGWSESEAKGQPLGKVLQLFDQVTGLAIHDIFHEPRSSSLSPFSNHTLIRRGDCQEFILEHSVAPIRRPNGNIIGMVVVCRDVTENRKLAAQLSWEASHDPLTSLINRREFKRKLSALMEEKSYQESQHTLCYLDLDQFKIVNDTCGHAAGDELLRQVTALLQSQIRKSDLLARLGGDEFGLLLYDCSLPEAKQVAETLRQVVQDFRFIWQDKTFSIGVSIGLVNIDPMVASLADVMSAADSAMYAAKEAGRNRIHLYQVNDRELAQRQGDMQWVSRVVKALEEDRFCLCSQAIVPAQPNSGKADHYEILIRMTDENGMMVPPGMFIPAAERYNLMPQIDRWVIRHLFNYLSRQRKQLSSVTSNGKNPIDHDIYTVNLSGASFNDDRFFDFLQEQFAHYHIPPKTICFEVTETFAITNLNKAIQFITALKSLGCSFALDDFGSGMSSLTYLKNLPVDYVKIDGYFVKNILEDPVNAAMIEAINTLTHVIGLETIAEFVENEQILHKLQELGVDYVQGYGISKPTPLGGTLINLTAVKQKPKAKRKMQVG